MVVPIGEAFNRLLSAAIVVGFFVFFYSRMSGKSFKQILRDIKDIFGEGEEDDRRGHF